MNGVDAIAFTAGIGENTNLVRRKIAAYLGYLGITIDNEVNDATHYKRGACNCKRDSCACKIMRDQTESAVQKMENERQIRLEKHCQGKKLDNM